MNRIPPAEARNRWLNDIRKEMSDKTVYNYGTTAGQFCDFITDRGINRMDRVDSDLIQQFKEHRLEKVALITVRNDMSAVKQFIIFCESIGAATAGLHELIRIPKTTRDDEVSDDFLPQNEARAMLQYLEKYEYASERHIINLILWKTGMRSGALRGLDVDDFDPERPALELRHRAETETPLKNKLRGERDVLLRPEQGQAIQDYIDHTRPDATDRFGREPLLATEHGRRSRTSIQRFVYTATRPCHYTGTCPFENEGPPEDCEHNTWNGAYACPGSVSPHALRHGYITAARNAGQPRDVTKDRADVSDGVMERHYDHGNEKEKAERRRSHLEDI